MPKRMSIRARRRIHHLIEENPNAIGPRLGRVALSTNIPAYAFAEMLGVSETTVYRWFYGRADVPIVAQPKIKRLLQILSRARNAGDLPLKGDLFERISAVRDVVIKHRLPTSVVVS